MKHCPHCGAALADEARFCLYCMTSLDEKAPVAPPASRFRLRIVALAVAGAILLAGIGWGVVAMTGGSAPVSASASSGSPSRAASASSGNPSRAASASSGRTGSAVTLSSTADASSRGTVTSVETSSRAAVESASVSSEISKTSSATSRATSSATSRDSGLEWLPIGNPAKSASGTTGDCTWTLYENGVLTLSGKGATGDYASNDLPPWMDYYLDVTAIRVESGVTYLGAYAFHDLMKAETVTLPNTLTGLGPGVFAGSALTSVTLPADITDVPDRAFNFCNNLSQVTLPKGLRTIGDSAFNSCGSLREIVLPDGTVSIGEYAFCYGELSRITIPASVTSIGTHAFDSNVTILTTKGSYADAYAKAKRLTVEYLN